MTISRVVFHRILCSALLAAMVASAGRADDDIVKDDDEASPHPQQHPAPLQLQGGRVIVMGPWGGPFVAPPPAGAGEPRTGPYLGITAGPVTPQVRAQIDLPVGVGLSVDAVSADGPAAKAGVNQFDVIHKFNDQLVCSPDQLMTLVRVVGVGTKVPLTLMRGGREKVIEVVIEEGTLAPDAHAAPIGGGMPGAPAWPDMPRAVPQQFHGVLPPQMHGVIGQQLAEAMARAGAGGVMPGVANRGLGMQAFAVGPNAQTATTIHDARGMVEIRSANGKKTVTVRDPGGLEVYSGPLDTDEDLARVPEDYRDWVREVDGGQMAVPVPAGEAGEPAAEPPAANPAGGPTT